LHSGNIFSYTIRDSVIGDLGLCQQELSKKYVPDKIYGVIPYMAPEVLSKKLYTKKSDIYSFGMIMWEHTTGKKPFHYREHDQYLMLDILKGERPQITNDTPEFYAELMKKCWDHNPENRPTAKEIWDFLWEYFHDRISEERKEAIEAAEAKRQEIIKSEKYLLDTKNYKHHPESFYTSHLLNKSIEQAESLSSLSLTEIQMNNKDNDDNKNGTSDKKNYQHHHPGSFYTNCTSNGLAQQIEPLLNLSSTKIGSSPKTHCIEDIDEDNSGSIRKKIKNIT